MGCESPTQRMIWKQKEGIDCDALTLETTLSDEDWIDPGKITYDEIKRTKILSERGLDLADSGLVFAGEHFQILDDRKDYGEPRYRVWGFLRNRRVSLVWTPRNGTRRIITMRYAHEREHEERFRSLD